MLSINKAFTSLSSLNASNKYQLVKINTVMFNDESWSLIWHHKWKVKANNKYRPNHWKMPRDQRDPWFILLAPLIFLEN